MYIKIYKCFFLLFFIPSIFLAQDLVPNIPIEDKYGVKYDLHDVLEENKNYIIETSVEWCGWCKKELIEWKECYESWEENYNVEVIALAADGTGTEDKQDMLDFYAEENLNYTLYFAENHIVVQNFGIEAYPTNFLINGKGEIVHTVKGYNNCEKTTTRFKRFFGQIDNETVIITKIGDALFVKKGILTEEFNIEFYTIDGILISQIFNKMMSEIILIPKYNGLLVVKVNGSNWTKSQLISLQN